MKDALEKAISLENIPAKVLAYSINSDLIGIESGFAGVDFFKLAEKRFMLVLIAEFQSESYDLLTLKNCTGAHWVLFIQSHDVGASEIISVVDPLSPIRMEARLTSISPSSFRESSYGVDFPDRPNPIDRKKAIVAAISVELN